MKKLIYITFCFLLFSFIKADRIEKKTNKILLNTFKEIDFEKSLIPIVSKNKDEKWYKVIDKTSKNPLGILETTSTKGKFDKFDFMVLYNMDKTINKVRVLIYREDHGGEIGSKRWLRQFEGKSIKNSKSLYQEVDGISGATLSSNAITNEIKSSLIKVQKIN
jgi:Na+-translocating ferredoxin:NAD+ oxidoreductase RnfG subunit